MTEPTNPASQPSDEARLTSIRRDIEEGWAKHDVEFLVRQLDAARAEIATLKRRVDELEVAEVGYTDNEEWYRLRIKEKDTELARLRSAAPSGDLRAENAKLRETLGIIAHAAAFPHHKRTDTEFLRATAVICYEQATAALASPQPDAGARGEAPKTDLLPGWWLKCKVTGNQCGTDTWAVGHPCQCENCQELLRIMYAPSPSPEAALLSVDAVARGGMTDVARDLLERLGFRGKMDSNNLQIVVSVIEQDRKRHAAAAPPSKGDVARIRHALGEPTADDKRRAEQLWEALKGETALGVVELEDTDTKYVVAICAAAMWALRCSVEDAARQMRETAQRCAIEWAGNDHTRAPIEIAEAIDALPLPSTPKS